MCKINYEGITLQILTHGIISPLGQRCALVNFNEIDGVLLTPNLVS